MKISAVKTLYLHKKPGYSPGFFLYTDRVTAVIKLILLPHRVCRSNSYIEAAFAAFGEHGYAYIVRSGIDLCRARSGIVLGKDFDAGLINIDVQRNSAVVVDFGDCLGETD